MELVHDHNDTEHDKEMTCEDFQQFMEHTDAEEAEVSADINDFLEQFRSEDNAAAGGAESQDLEKQVSVDAEKESFEVDGGSRSRSAAK